MSYNSTPRACEGCGVIRIFKESKTRFCSKKCWATQKDPPASERFWSKVLKTNGCWMWIGAINSSGYGSFWWDGKTQNAVRASWELHFGAIENGLHVLHRCDVRACVRPDHLFLGTNAENMADRDSKGRCQKGERHVEAKLTREQATNILRAHAEGEKIADLARKHGVGYMCVYCIVKRKNWKDL